MRGSVRLLAAISAIGLLVTACSSASNNGNTGGASPSTGASTGATSFVKGGTLNIGMNSDFHEGDDPAREYYTIGWEVLHCCLARTLLSYNLKGPSEQGNTVVPDLATALPTASSDGLTYTFTIRPDVHYAPPLQNVTVTASDFIRALMREGDSATTASYPFYYDDISGFSDFSGGKAKTISGLSAPSPTQLVVKLDKPLGYFNFIWTLPATAPIPPSPTDPNAPEGIATGHGPNFAQFISSTGPYMWQGADQIDYNQAAKSQKAASGYQAGKSYVLVRNPSWSAATDQYRKAYVDEMQFTVGATVPDLQNKIESGELDTMDQQPNAEGIQAYETNPALKAFIHSDPTFGEYYINMNMGIPPFDDVHVRKAMNWVVDRAGLLRLFGGPIKGSVITHDIPNTMLPAESSYNPYATPGNAGSVDKAKQEMMQSKYDTNHDGVCDASACKNVLAVIDGADPMPKLAALLQQNAAQIGIQLKLQPFQTTTMYTKCETATEKVPLCPSEGWYADFNDPAGYVTGLFDSSSLTPSCCDDSELGATAADLHKWGYPTSAPIVNMDTQLHDCIPVSGAQRETCYVNVDHTLMEQAVPWIPWIQANQVVITSQRVQNYHLDASTGWISIALVALKNGGK
jgi:peptide/nickel transport system substrate-binding protein